MTTNGMLIAISTPYRKIGLLHQKHRDYFGEDNNDTLVVHGKSTTFNPNLTESAINQALIDDPESSRTEWEAEWRSDLAQFLDDAVIDAAVDHSRPLELPPRKFRYLGFSDPSGGRSDAFTLCIGHKEGETFVADVVRGKRGALDPFQVARDYAELLKEYKLTEVHGDSYSAEWVVSAFRDAGITYKNAEKPKSALYLEAEPLFTRGAITIPNLAVLLTELRLLERGAHRGGHISVDHPRRGHDDYANVVCGAAALASKGGYDFSGDWIDGPKTDAKTEAERNREWRDAQYRRFVMSGGRIR
jgi:hypothetical protein